LENIKRVYNITKSWKITWENISLFTDLSTMEQLAEQVRLIQQQISALLAQRVSGADILTMAHKPATEQRNATAIAHHQKTYIHGLPRAF
jgi:hypothetical protein